MEGKLEIGTIMQNQRACNHILSLFQTRRIINPIFGVRHSTTVIDDYDYVIMRRSNCIQNIIWNIVRFYFGENAKQISILLLETDTMFSVSTIKAGRFLIMQFF